eukprot:10256310-Alexandrium_andersonii.AAC.1
MSSAVLSALGTLAAMADPDGLAVEFGRAPRSFTLKTTGVAARAWPKVALLSLARAQDHVPWNSTSP